MSERNGKPETGYRELFVEVPIPPRYAPALPPPVREPTLSVSVSVAALAQYLDVKVWHDPATRETCFTQRCTRCGGEIVMRVSDIEIARRADPADVVEPALNASRAQHLAKRRCANPGRDPGNTARRS